MILFQPVPIVQPLWGFLAEPKVQTELHLGSTEKAEINAAIKTAKAQIAKELLTRPDREAISYKGKVLGHAGRRLEEIGQKLTSLQKGRLIEITMQAESYFVFDEEGVRIILAIDETQYKKIRDDREATRQSWGKRIDAYAKKHAVPMRGLKGGGRTPMLTPEILKLWHKEELAIWDAIYRDLSKNQNSRLKQMLGRPFKV